MERSRIHGLGEIALRVRNPAVMHAFDEGVVGREVLGAFPHAVFFRSAAGVAGHTQVLALLDRSPLPAEEEPSHARTTLDHLAFGIAREDDGAVRARLEGLGLAVRTAEHAWVHWRSLDVSDPKGNPVEWVCDDERVGRTATTPKLIGSWGAEQRRTIGTSCVSDGKRQRPWRHPASSGIIRGRLASGAGAPAGVHEGER